eukprot:TRINITY_DN43439_c0_g1_i1.p1 TRINITY_DN43439_c0_g1~~TRINITY_DN43439_c0_g1_i1.p1  ORF type:complete len:156 (+),score=68.10 TRINITY_DN43439_c0_g1_i1:103-570(+)
MKVCVALFLCVCAVSAAEDEGVKTQPHDGKFVEKLATQMTEVMTMGIKQGYGVKEGSKLLEADSVKVGLGLAMSISKKLEFFREHEKGEDAGHKAYQRTIADLAGDVERNWPKRATLDAEENCALYTVALYLRAAFPQLRETMSALLDPVNEDEL